MKLKLIITFAFFLGAIAYSQNSNKILFTIDNEPYYSSEFLTVYNKNLNVVPDSKDNTIENYLQLFVDYKLKVKNAKEIGLDTVKSYIDELKQYKNSLVLPYLADKEVTDKLVKEAYERMKIQIDASHILIFVDEDAKPADTLTAYNKLVEARNLIVNGQDFEVVAKQFSQDPSAAQNGGKLGYFSVLQMVYPFENAAYLTAVGEVSMPFRTKFGYHIVKVNDIKESQGEVEVAHIMFKNKSGEISKKVDSIYQLVLKNPTDFEMLAQKFSDDNSSAPNGGRLKKFNYGQMIEDFADVAFSLQNVGAISKPFQTAYGWHIVKLLNKYPLESFEALEPKLTQQVESDERSKLIGKSVVNRLLKEYNVEVYNDALNQFKTDDWKQNPEKFDKKLLKIQDLEIYQNQFIKYLNSGNKQTLEVAFKAFEEENVINYYKENIQFTNKEFAATYKEFEEGLLLFAMLEKQVWDKSKDSIGLQNFYESNKNSKYLDKDLEANKGLVISDYQNYLEKQWVQGLHQKYQVEFVEREKKRLFKENLK